MIVPQSRLLWWFGLVALPFSVVGALHPEALGLSLALVGLLVCVAALDAALGASRLEGLAIELPEVVRLSHDREGGFEIRVRNARRLGRRLRLGLPLPPEIRSVWEETTVVLPSGAELSRLQWRCTPLRRGQYRLAFACLETASPLGLWAKRAVAPVNMELRVYPNLHRDRRDLAALFLNRGGFGVHAQRQVGKGREFEKLRDYIPGDSFEDIHWKATAKRGRPITKTFQIEKTQELYVVIDASRLSARVSRLPSERQQASPGPAAAEAAAEGETRSASALERYITAALVLGLAAEQQGDLFGLLTFTDRVQRFVRAGNGKAHYGVCRDALYTLEPAEVTPDFEELAAFIRLRLRRRALLVFLTALDDPVLAEGFVGGLDLLCRQHLLLVNMLKPPGAHALFTRPDVAGVDDLYRHLAGHYRWHDLRELEKVMQRRGVQFSLLEHERLSVQLVSQYLGVKQRQLL